MEAIDPRVVLDRLVTAGGESYAALSRMLRRNPAYLQQYVKRGTPRLLAERDRKLLLHRRELDSLYGKVREKGLTLVPIRLYFKDGRVKVELALAKGKEQRDKRREIAKRESDRQIERALKSRR